MLRKTVNIYLKIKFNYQNLRNCGILVMEYKGVYKIRYLCILERTCNRAIIIAAKNAIDLLKEPCEVNLYLQTNIGFKFLENNKKWRNRDLGEKLIDAIIKERHVVNFIDCSMLSEGISIQKMLERKLALFKKL